MPHTDLVKPNWGLDERTIRVLRVIGLVSSVVLLGLAVLGMFFLRFWSATVISVLVSLYSVVVIVLIVRRMAADHRG